MGQAQLRLFSPADEAGCYHDTARQGFFSLLMATCEGSGKKQDSYRLSQMPVVLSMLDHSRDTWLSQAEFIKPNRRVVNLARIGLLFADLDTYREPWAQGRSPEQLAAAVDPRFLWPWRASKVAAGWHLAASGAATLECLPALPDRPSGRAGR